MKDRKKLDLLRNIDPKFIEEADPTKPISHHIKRRQGRSRIALVAACLSVSIILSALLVLFVPYDQNYMSVIKYRDSEYYGVIQAINRANGSQAYKNNFERLLSSFVVRKDSGTTDAPNSSGGIDKDDSLNDTGIYNGSSIGSSPSSGMIFRPTYDDLVSDDTGSNPDTGTETQEEYTSSHDQTSADEYTEAESESLPLETDRYGASTPDADAPTENETLNSEQDIISPDINDSQVAGVSELDMIKRSPTHIFYLYASTLYAYKIDGENTVCVGKQTVVGEPVGFYLSRDFKTATVITQYHDSKIGTNGYSSQTTVITSYDVIDPASITKKAEASFSGQYISSRMQNGKLFISLYAPIDTYSLDFSDSMTFVPYINESGQIRTISAEDIIYTESTKPNAYTVLAMIDEETLEFDAVKALLGFSGDVYVNREHIFLYSNSMQISRGLTYTTRKNVTDIVCLKYSDLSLLGGITLDGSILNQYSLDEYRGILRAVTTTTTYEVTYNNGWRNIKTNANLYCIDMATWNVTGSSIGFSPDESVRSVTFNRENAYVCTSIQATDPVFFFDLSDINNITHIDTGTIPGFSTSLVDFGHGDLLGIGRGDQGNTLKLEIFRDGGDKVSSVACLELTNTGYSQNYSSYYIDRENQLLGLGISQYGIDGGEYYLLLHLDGEEIHELKKFSLDGQMHSFRGVLVGDFFYVFGGIRYEVIALSSLISVQ